MIKQSGFTLIEVVIAMAIIGILAAIAYPSYLSYAQRSRRTDAQGALLSFANAMETHFADTESYCDAGGLGGVSSCGTATNDTGSPTIHPAQSPVNGGTVYYNLTINSVTANSFTLYAVPAGNQVGDKCGTLTLTNTGAKSITAAAAGTVATDCW